MHELLRLVDEDTRAFDRVLDAMRLPKGTDAERATRRAVMDQATLEATRVPFQVMEAALGAMPLLKAMVEIGQPSSTSDAAVGALCARSAVLGAYLNVLTNAAQLPGNAAAADLVARGAVLQQQAIDPGSRDVLALAEAKIRPADLIAGTCPGEAYYPFRSHASPLHPRLMTISALAALRAPPRAGFRKPPSGC